MKINYSPGIPDSEFSLPFVQGMADRMSVSFCKYGAVAEAYPHKVDALASLQQRLDKYRSTGNTEFLIDAANFAMIEFMHPRVGSAHFRPTDSNESPGRTLNSGVVSDTANTLSRENQRRGGSKMQTSGGFYRNEGD